MSEIRKTQEQSDDNKQLNAKLEVQFVSDVNSLRNQLESSNGNTTIIIILLF